MKMSVKFMVLCMKLDWRGVHLTWIYFFDNRERASPFPPCHGYQKYSTLIKPRNLNFTLIFHFSLAPKLIFDHFLLFSRVPEAVGEFLAFYFFSFEVWVWWFSGW